jgi:hypothetical protein
MKRKYQTILEKAISELPHFHLKNEEVWKNISSRLDHIENIKNSLPKFEAPGELWERIEERLNNEDSINKTVEKSTPAVLILKKVSGKSLFIKYSIAASIVLLLGLSTWKFTRQSGTNGKIIYSVESSGTIEKIQPEINDDTENNLNTMISEYCKFSPGVCNSSRFLDLQKELTDINKVYDELKEKITRDPNDQLYKYLFRIENERVTVQKELLQIFKAS